VAQPLAGVTVHDTGTTVATAHAARVLGALGAAVITQNPSAPLLDGGSTTEVPPGDADIVLHDDPGDERPGTVDVAIVAADGEPDDAERRLQEQFGLAALTGEPDGPPMLLAGWPVLLHCGAQAAAAALIGLIAHQRGVTAPRLRVNAHGAAIAMLDDAAVRARRGLAPRERTRGAQFLERSGRLVRARDGWVSLSMSGDDEWQAVTMLARHAGFESVATWIAQHSRRQVFDVLQAMRLACGMGLTPREVLEDPLLVERNAVRGGRVASPFRCQIEHGTRWSPAPLRGALPLRDLRVVELAALWAGPAATALLARWGATVVKVESPQRLDGFRDGDGTRFETFNAGKRSVLLDLSDERGRASLHALLRDADVLVDAHSPRVLPNWGLDTSALRALNPSLVVLHLPALGGEPDAWPQHIAFGFDQEMLCGQAVLDAGAPVRPAGIPLGDPVAAIAAAAAALAAVWLRMRSGNVSHIELAQRDALLHQVAPRCHAARRGHAWPGDGLAGVVAESARTAAEALSRDDIDVRPDRCIEMADGPQPQTMPAPRPGEHTAAELQRSGISSG
jgi:crotonobetainyl-CoA:carnitine CoA-transferase CaiB-like acyl-CoA transferase